MIFENTEDAFMLGKYADIEDIRNIKKSRLILEQQYERLKKQGVLEYFDALMKLATQIQFHNEALSAYKRKATI